MIHTPIRCLLLGATGFLGSQIRTRLAETPGVELLTAARSRHADTHVQLDLARVGLPRLEALLHDVQPHVVVNCAGATRGDAAELVAGNVVVVAALAQAVVRAVPSARLVHLGSAAEYGRVESGKAVSESARPEPLSAYGISKLAGTALLRSAVDDVGLDAVVLRVFNPIGPDAPENTLPGRLVAELRRTARTGEDILVGPLDAYRDFVDVRDVAEAVAAAALTPARVPFLLNVGSGRATGLRELAKAMAAVAGTEQRLVESEPGSFRSADVPWQQADISAARHALNWLPSIDLSTSLRDMWQGSECLT
jgi:nucleoside-diphosphate-sugar epimerase